jgi:hypothetical protein
METFDVVVIGAAQPAASITIVDGDFSSHRDTPRHVI